MTELEEKLNKLTAWIQTSHITELDAEDQRLLRSQAETMQQYLDLLKQRLERMGIDSRQRIRNSKEKLTKAATDLRDILQSYVDLYDETDPVALNAIAQYDAICLRRGVAG